MIAETDIRRLARYFANEGTDDERQATETWLAEDPARRAEAEQLSVLWRVSGVPSWTPNTDAAWTSLAARLHVGEAQVPLTLMPSVAPHQPHTFQWRRAQPRRVARLILGAAALLAASIIAFVMGREQESSDRVARAKPAETAARDFRTARGQRAVVVLGDGSRVELGAESVLRVGESSTGRRVVQLDGQAVFDVVHDSLRPFEVQSGNSITEDLGTRFTVRAYRDESRVQVFVASGKVALRAVGSPASSGTLLGPSDLGVLDSVGRTTVRNGVDSTSHLAWTRDRFVFDNATLADVLSDIARWFDVKIEVAEPQLLHHRITMNVPARSLSEVVGAVTTPLRLRFTKRGSTIVIQ
jgi:ferric-dicitrate binding protein FerR (iron transport regulator)